MLDFFDRFDLFLTLEELASVWEFFLLIRIFL